MERRYVFNQAGMLCRKRTSRCCSGAVEKGGVRVAWARLRDEESLISSLE